MGKASRTGWRCSRAPPEGRSLPRRGEAAPKATRTAREQTWPWTPSKPSTWIGGRGTHFSGPDPPLAVNGEGVLQKLPRHGCVRLEMSYTPVFHYPDALERCRQRRSESAVRTHGGTDRAPRPRDHLRSESRRRGVSERRAPHRHGRGARGAGRLLRDTRGRFVRDPGL